MRIILNFALTLSIMFLAKLSIAAPILLEDFSGSLNLQKFTDVEDQIKIDTTNQNLILSSKGSAFTRSFRSNWVGLLNQNIEMMQADIAVTSVSLGNSATQQAIARLGGYFYRSAIGDVWTTLHLGDRGNGLEAWYEIQELEDSSRNTLSVIQGTLSTATPILNTPYTVSIDFDGTNSFSFVFNNGSPVVVSGPTRTGLPTSLFKAIGTSIRLGGNNNTQNDLVDASPDDGSVASVFATFHNVITTVTTPAVLDDFASANLDITKWDTDEGSSEIVINQLVMKSKHQGTNRSSQTLHFQKKDFKTLGANVTLLSSSIGPLGTRVRGRVQHTLGNDTFNGSVGDVYNGYEGDIYEHISLEKNADGSFRIHIYGEKITDADYNTPITLFSLSIYPTIPINYNQTYALEIEQTAAGVNFKIDGVTNFTFDPSDTISYPVLSGNLYPASDRGFTQLQARVQSGPGEAHVRFDDVVTEGENRNLLTRAEIAKPLLQAKYGKAFVPPASSGILYDDVDAGDFNADWIEKLAVDGITEGCAATKFCPNMVVSKEQLSKLLLKAKHSSAYIPGMANGTIFNDISMTSFAADWIEELANQAISSGCDTDNFCSHEAATVATIDAMLGRAIP